MLLAKIEEQHRQQGTDQSLQLMVIPAYWSNVYFIIIFAALEYRLDSIFMDLVFRLLWIRFQSPDPSSRHKSVHKVL